MQTVGPIENGAALIKCSSAKGASAALAFDLKKLGDNSVQVRRAPANSQIGESSAKEPAALTLKGLPFKATEEDIAAFFEGYNMVSGSIKYQMNEDGRKTGLAAVLFESEEDKERAFKEKQK